MFVNIANLVFEISLLNRVGRICRGRLKKLVQLMANEI